MTTHVDTDPLMPFLRDIVEEHESTRHVEGVQCRGSVELIDETARLRGVNAVKLGKAISLEREIETRPEQLAALAEEAAREKKLWQELAVVELSEGHGSVELEVRAGVHGRSAHGGDVITYDAHGIHNTHMDGFAHIGADGTWHGGIPVEESQIHEDTMVSWAQHGVATRAVILDIPAVRGVDWVTAESPVTAEDLELALARTGVSLLPGDALVVYQGRDRFEAAGHRYQPGAVPLPRPGIGESGAKWIADQNPGILVWDFHDARSNETAALEVHGLIYAIGLCIIDNALLGPAVQELEKAGASTGFLVAAPTAIHRSTGVLINPLLMY